MKLLRLLSVLVPVLLLFPFDRAAAQAQGMPQRGCVWNCYHIMLPYGLYVRRLPMVAALSPWKTAACGRSACPSAQWHRAGRPVISWY